MFCGYVLRSNTGTIHFLGQRTVIVSQTFPSLSLLIAKDKNFVLKIRMQVLYLLHEVYLSAGERCVL